MSTGRQSCPPEWAVQLSNLIQALAGGCVALPLQPLCDPVTGLVAGYATAVYRCAAPGDSGQVTVLRFDANLNVVAALPVNLQICGGAGGGMPAAQLFQTSELVCVSDGAGGVREARQVITRDATGAVVSRRLEDPATGAVIAGAIVDCLC